jgi:flagellar protein FliT
MAQPTYNASVQLHKQVGPSHVLANYELLSALTGQMREAAEHGEWDQLISIEHQCSALVATMKTVDAEVALDEPAHQRKIELISKILADDAAIRNLTQIWMGQLQLNMQSNRQEQLLLHAYGV